MFERIKNWFLPSRRRALAKRRLERVAVQCGCSISQSKRITAYYFNNDLTSHLK